jgi:serine protease Do
VNSQNSFNSIITKVEPSVVMVKVVKDRVKTKDVETITRGGGSGFFISNDGYILTNEHVINKAKEINITTSDLTSYSAKVIGSDIRTDIAILKIDKKTIPISIGDYKSVNKGDWVIAIGSPYGLDWSISKGIVSHTARDTNKLLLMLQTDTPINTGNSGGPLINTKGQVIAINSGMITDTGGYQGISLAIPIDKAMIIANQIKQFGKVTRASLNVELIEIDNGNPENTNVSVYNVLSQESNLKQDDLILKVNSIAVSKALQVSRLINELKVGSMVKLSILRDTKVLTIEQVLK